MVFESVRLPHIFSYSFVVRGYPRRQNYLPSAIQKAIRGKYIEKKKTFVCVRNIFRALATVGYKYEITISRLSLNVFRHYCTFTTLEVEERREKISPGGLFEALTMNLTSVSRITLEYGRLRKVWVRNASEWTPGGTLNIGGSVGMSFCGISTYLQVGLRRSHYN